MAAGQKQGATHPAGQSGWGSATIGRPVSARHPGWRFRLFHALKSIESTLMPPPLETDTATQLDPPNTFNHEQALQACARGDHQALQKIYQHESRYLLGVALRIVRQRQQAEDVLHDAFMNIWTRSASFDATAGSGRGWIYSVVRNQALNAVRSNGREVSVDEETAEALEAQTSLQAYHQLADAFETHVSMGKLNDCLSRLEPSRRNCILYAYVDGCSHGEIAARTQTPLGTVKAWIKRGMGSLRECMA